jgi:hypothetical protein
MANPTAVEVKLLLSEYKACGESGPYGAHHPSATTWPCRRSMKLCRLSMSLFADSMNDWMAAEEMPCASGLLRGKSAARATEALKATTTRIERVFMVFQRE